MKAILYKLKKIIRILLCLSGYYFYRFKKHYSASRIDENWAKRVDDVLSCDDHEAIPRVQNAGLFTGNAQVMHNGLKIKPGSFYGTNGMELLRQTKGVHEPQEEKVFGEVLNVLPQNAVMIELGSYWSFYSMWFYSKVKNAKCYMIEPYIIAYYFGKANFRLNGMKGDFTNASITSRSSVDANGERSISIDDFVIEKGITQIDILHSDIQGHEYEMLLGAKQCFERKMIRYLFISTHSDEVHKECLAFLSGYNFEVIAVADLLQTYSVDGLIVAKAPFVKQPGRITIALKH